MTEAEWLDRKPGFFVTSAWMKPRRQRLLAAAICRSLEWMLSFDGVSAVIETIEHFADTGVSKAALRRARQAIQALRDELRNQDEQPNQDLVWALYILQVAASENAYTETFDTAMEIHQHLDGLSDEGAMRVLYRPAKCIIGNPFRPVTFSPSWRSETAVALAAGIYDGRHFDRLPILADALEEAGCDHPDILAHCRDPQQPHARGCWVVDLLLGKK